MADIPNIPVMVRVNNPPRGSGTQAVRTFAAQSTELTTAWGTNPASAQITYVAQTGFEVPVTEGALVRIQVAGHVFWGICRSDQSVDSANGRTRTLEYVDLRYYLGQDDVFGCFNIPDVRQVNGNRIKRYLHVLPEDWETGRKTFTTQPKSAAEIIYRLLRAPTVLSPWYNDVAPVIYHPDQITGSVDSLDFMGGRKLVSALEEIGNKQGLVMGLLPNATNPYQLIWVRKGQGVLPTWDVAGQPSIYPPNSDMKRLGVSLSGNPNIIRVVGGRNAYQVLNVALRPDWNPNWQEFYDVLRLYEDIYERFATDVPLEGVPVGTPYKDVMDSTVAGAVNHHLVGWQLAMGRALTITVGEYARARGDKDFSDYRLFGGRSRMDMPVVMYMNQILFRAFRPPAQINLGDGWVQDLVSLELVGRMLMAVEHDPVTGTMDYVADRPTEGNGYAIAKGLLANVSALLQVEPERLNIARFAEQNETWSPLSFQIDNSGEDGGYVLFDQAVVKQADVLGVKDGYAVIKANWTFTVPEVRAALCFEAERFVWVVGDGGTISHVENVSELARECVVKNSSRLELVYGDGRTAGEKAQEIGEALLRQQWAYASGGYVHYIRQGDAPILLNSMYDRVTIRHTPQGLAEEVDFTTERQGNAFTPERLFDRRQRERGLLPGQAELMAQARKFNVFAAALRQSPGFRAELNEAWTGAVGFAPKTGRTMQIMPKTGVTSIPVGSVVWMSTDKGAQAGVGTAVEAGKHVLFAGVTVRDAEKPGRRAVVVHSGPALARVTLGDKPMKAFTQLVIVPGTDAPEGEVAAGDALTEYYGDSQSVIVASLLEDLPAATDSGEVRLARVNLGQPMLVPEFEARVVLVGNFYLRVKALYDDREYLALKPQSLFTPADTGDYVRVSSTERKVTYQDEPQQVTEIIRPAYGEEDVMGEQTILVRRVGVVRSYQYALDNIDPPDDLGEPLDELPEVLAGLEDQLPIRLVDANLSARRWVRKPGTYVLPPED